MSILNEKDCILIVIDIQEKLLKAVYNKHILEKKAVIMAKTATMLSIPTIVTEQYPVGLGSTVDSVLLALPAGTSYFEKSSFSVLEVQEIVEILRTSRKHQVILLGIETHICVNQTANALVEAGYDVTVIADACGCRDEAEHRAGIERLKENGAHIVTTEMALFELLKTAKHPAFKEIQQMIK